MPASLVRVARDVLSTVGRRGQPGLGVALTVDLAEQVGGARGEEQDSTLAGLGVVGGQADAGAVQVQVRPGLFQQFGRASDAFWCALLVSNQRPPPCEGDALPLS